LDLAVLRAQRPGEDFRHRPDLPVATAPGFLGRGQLDPTFPGGCFGVLEVGPHRRHVPLSSREEGARLQQKLCQSPVILFKWSTCSSHHSIHSSRLACIGVEARVYRWPGPGIAAEVAASRIVPVRDGDPPRCGYTEVT